MPWLAVLALLLVKPNRCAQAWWIWVPLGSLAALSTGLAQTLDWLPAPLNQVFSDLALLLGFGTAATWLLASYLGLRHRALTFLGLLLVSGVFGFLAFLFTQDWSGGAADPNVWALATIGGIGAGVFALALTFAGLFGRKRYRPARLCLYTLLLMLSLWTLIAAPFFIVALIASNGRAGGVGEFLLPLCGITLATFLAVAPFLVLSFLNSFYRNRLKNLLKLGLESAVPPVIQTPAPAGVVMAAAK